MPDNTNRNTTTSNSNFTANRDLNGQQDLKQEVDLLFRSYFGQEETIPAKEEKVPVKEEVPVQKEETGSEYLGLYHPQEKKEAPAEESKEESAYLGLYNPAKKDEEKEEKEEKEETYLGLYNPNRAKEMPEELKKLDVLKEETPFIMSEEDDELFQVIVNNVNKHEEDKREGLEGPALGGSDVKDLDSIFSEVIAHTDNGTQRWRIQEPVKKKEEVPTPIDHSDIIRMIQEIQTSNDTYFNNYAFKPEEEAEAAPKADDSTDAYISSLIEELRDRMAVEDQRREEAEAAYQAAYESIHQQYPYLSNGFIHTLYELKDAISHEYPYRADIILLHRIRFKDVDNLRQFVEIALNHGFAINADEEKMIVDVFKQHVNTDGKIVSMIFSVANQAALLNGDYEGYTVLLAEKA